MFGKNTAINNKVRRKTDYNINVYDCGIPRKGTTYNSYSYNR